MAAVFMYNNAVIARVNLTINVMSGIYSIHDLTV